MRQIGKLFWQAHGTKNLPECGEVLPRTDNPFVKTVTLPKLQTNSVSCGKVCGVALCVEECGYAPFFRCFWGNAVAKSQKNMLNAIFGDLYALTVDVCGIRGFLAGKINDHVHPAEVIAIVDDSLSGGVAAIDRFPKGNVCLDAVMKREMCCAQGRLVNRKQVDCR